MAYTKTQARAANHKKYIVRLDKGEVETLEELVASKASKQKRQRAQILLRADVGKSGDEGWTDELIAEALGCSVKTVGNIRKRFVEEGLEATLERKRQRAPSVLRKIDGEAEARIIALACGEPPKGRARWTYRLLADKVVELGIVDEVSHKTVWETLKKTNFDLI